MSRTVPGHDRWHPEIPAVAEVITGGSIRLECQRREPGAEPVLCGPVTVVGAEPGDVIVVDVIGVGRSDGRHAPAGHPGVIGCAPDAAMLTAAADERAAAEPEAGTPRPGADVPGLLLGHLEEGSAEYRRVAAEAVSSRARGRQIGGCGIAPLTAGSRILLPVHVPGAKLSVGDLHFPASGAEDCRAAAGAGWIDLRVHLTRRGVERFRVNGPLLMPAPRMPAGR
ncbi:hypothetical protein Arub01_08110 [Actinomadura rubrobrunea]|uniref:Formamidase n=1 Tax=Actinomadura rubrobrunea TaxID=115335 RepID=A0A9W6UUT2_9ACTN|nr:acetamidase/formamidase family protein [Actinomadura rubrobrunea]GLW62567.1 hypothetical protein Arub01_08110 [Actinomadura rubrobrunea]